MYCIECGQAQPVQEARYCPFCGTALFRAVTGAAAVASPVSAPGAQGDQARAAASASPEAQAQAPTDAATATTALEPISASSAAASGPLNSASALILDRSRWVPLDPRAGQLRARLRWAMRLAVVLAIALGAGAAWWWTSRADDEIPVEVEAIDSAPTPPGDAASAPVPLKQP